MTTSPARSALDPYLAAIDAEIRAHLRAEEPALRPFYEMMAYHLGLDVGASGKRLRPLVCVLVHEGLAGDFRPALPAAAAVELLHNFTLVHDDIQDQDATRRHRPTVWSVWGVPQAINAGDGMYALSRVAVQRLRELGIPAPRVLEAIAVLDRACVRVCEGQFLDISYEARIDVRAERYRAMVARKTGALHRAAAELGAVLATDEAATRDTFAAFGERFGEAFQAHDDLLGIWGAAAETGKEEMNDLAKRKMTLPLVLALERASATQRSTIATAYAKQPPIPADDVGRVREILDALAMRAEVERFVARERERALAILDRVALGSVPSRLLRQIVLETTGARA